VSISRRRKVLLVGLPLLLVVVGGVAVRVGRDRWAGRCAAVTARVATETLPSVRFQSPDQFRLGTPAWSKDWWAQSLVAAGKNPPALGTFRGAVRIDADELNGTADFMSYRPLAGVVDSSRGDVLLRTYPRDHPDGILMRVNRSADAKAWAVPTNGAYRDIPEGRDQLILADLPTGRSRLVSIARDSGRTTWCEELGDQGTTQGYGPAIASDLGSGSLFLARPAGNFELKDSTVMVSRRNLADGRLVWEVPADGFNRTATVEPFQDLALVAKTGPAMNNNDRFRQFGGDPELPGDVVQARAAADGALRWTYRGPDTSGWVNSIVGVDGGTAVVLSQRDRGKSPAYLEDERSHPEFALRTTSWLIGLGSDGKERWRQSLGNRLYSWRGFGTTVVSGLALSVEGDLRQPFENQFVVARDVSTGAVRWRTRVADYNLAPDFAGARRVGDVLLVGTEGGKLISIDLRTGAVEQPLGDTELTGLAVDDRSVTVNASGLLLTFDRPG
jgi:outer membrane protein assembly factor BamB